jgi:NDP-sugar pyrophosphorylase family protein
MTLHPAQVADFWPLHQDSPIGQQLIAGSTLSDWQLQLAAGIDEAQLIENAWVTSEDWQNIAAQPRPAALQTKDGHLLAWTGDDQAAALSNSVTTTDGSFLIRYPWDFIQVNEQLVLQLEDTSSEGEISPAAHIDGIISVGKGSRILPGVVIEGNAIIGANCKIGPNCYLRGSTTIGDNCHIGQAVEIKNSIIGHHSSIGHLSYVGDSVIGNHVNFGAGTITSNLRHDGTNHLSRVRDELIDTGRRKFGTVVGDGSHTGILTAIYPGRKLGPNSQTLPNQTVKRDIT